ncbi:MAG: metallophosphoesterase [Acholeplasmataceae bacterium]|nr:metallophosphoesterase [Acholeplasmataceae bacterium]
MKNQTMIWGLLTMMLFSLGLSININSKTQTASTSVDQENIVLEFAAISDIHLKSYPSIEQDRFASAIKLSYQNTNNLDAVVINGDFTDGGHDPQYASFMSILNQEVSGDTEVIVNLGNHENGRNESDSHAFFTETMGYGIDHVFNVKGYTFITLGVHYGDKFLDSQAIWLDEQLEIATQEHPDQPVFVLIHYPAYQTTVNSTGNGRTTYKEVLEKYAQVVHISGHSHPALQDPRTIHQDKFTSFNNSSLTYLFYEKADYTGAQDSASVGQFAIIKVTDTNKVIIERHVIDDNQMENSIKLDGDYLIDIPLGRDGFTYTTGWYDDGTNPYFNETADINLNKVQNNWFVTFDQALDQQFVYYYHIYVKDLQTNEVVTVLKPNSQFYKIESPDQITRQINEPLMPGRSYEITIVAISVTNRFSEPLIKTINT